MRLYLFGRLITPLANGDTLDVHPGWLAVDRSGAILRAGAGDPPRAFRGFEVTDLRPFLALPGFVDAHLHFPQIDVRGHAAPDLLTWLARHVFPAEEACDEPAVARTLAARTFRELARNGVTTAAVFGSTQAQGVDAAFGEALRSGLRIFLGKTMMDRNGPESLLQSRERNLELSRRLCRNWDGQARGRIRYAFSPRFAPACSFELLQDTARVARETGALVQTHLAETPAEVAWVKQLFPGARSYLDVYRAAGLTERRTVLGHAIHLDDEDWNVLRSRDCAIAHCPTSNFFLRSGTFDLARAVRERVRLGLGSDVGAGPSFSPFDCLRHALYLAPLAPSEVLQRATLGGAEALAVADRAGTLEPEKDADVAVVDPEQVETSVTAPLETVLGALIYRGGASTVVGTLAAGAWVHVDPALNL